MVLAAALSATSQLIFNLKKFFFLKEQIVLKHVNELFLAPSSMPIMLVCEPKMLHCDRQTCKVSGRRRYRKNNNVNIWRKKKGEKRQNKKTKLNITAWYLDHQLALRNLTVEFLCRNILVRWWTVHGRCLPLGYRRKKFGNQFQISFIALYSSHKDQFQKKTSKTLI